jgi:hypothetical protein
MPLYYYTHSYALSACMERLESIVVLYIHTHDTRVHQQLIAFIRSVIRRVTSSLAALLLLHCHRSTTSTS